MGKSIEIDAQMQNSPPPKAVHISLSKALALNGEVYNDLAEGQGHSKRYKKVFISGSIFEYKIL